MKQNLAHYQSLAFFLDQRRLVKNRSYACALRRATEQDMAPPFEQAIEKRRKESLRLATLTSYKEKANPSRKWQLSRMICERLGDRRVFAQHAIVQHRKIR